VRADPAAVRGARCVLDKLRRALERPLARLRRARSPDLPAAAAVYQHALLAFARRLLQARAQPVLAVPHQTRMLFFFAVNACTVSAHTHQLSAAAGCARAGWRQGRRVALLDCAAGAQPQARARSIS